MSEMTGLKGWKLVLTILIGQSIMAGIIIVPVLALDDYSKSFLYDKLATISRMRNSMANHPDGTYSGLVNYYNNNLEIDRLSLIRILNEQEIKVNQELVR